MFKGTTTFSYGGGIASASNGWSYSIKDKFFSQIGAQPQYRDLTQIDAIWNIPYGARLIADMAMSLADSDYRAKYGVIPGTNLSEFGAWQDQNRQAIYNEAAGWFASLAPAGGGGGGGDTGGGEGGGDTGGGGGGGSQQENPFDLLTSTPVLLIGGFVLLFLFLKK